MIRKSGLGVALVLVLCAGAQAQSHRQPSRPVRVGAPAGKRMAQISTSSGALNLTGSGVVLVNGAGFVSLNTIGTLPVPGLGFDFAHVAALNRNLKVSDISVLSTAERLTLARSLTPIVPFFLPLLPTTTPIIVVQQSPPVVVVQQAAQEAGAEPGARARYAEPTEKTEPTRPPEPARELEEFVLVRLDGKVLFAVAFSTEGKILTYITREGIRRSLPLAELDLDATRRMNEERGTTIRLPVEQS